MDAQISTLDLTGQAKTRVRASLSSSVAGVAGDVAAEAKNLLRTSPRSGRMYRGIRASAPGQAPNDPSGALADSISVESDEVSAAVTAGAPYAAYLELGTAKMAPRPFLSPAAELAFGRAEDALTLPES